MNLRAMALTLAMLLPPAAQAAEPKTLRYALSGEEAGFDPVRVNERFSSAITAHIFEALYTFDPLARPVKRVPLIAAAEPDISADFKTFKVRLRPGIYFAADPAFKGQHREVTAQDFVYSIKRVADPANLSQQWKSLEDAQLLGLNELRQHSVTAHAPFNYDQEIEGLRAIDRYTLLLRTREARPRLVDALLVGNATNGVVAREVVERYGPSIAEHPVGTGPFVLAAWRRNSQIVLQRNPDYRERRYDAQPDARDAEGQALLAQLKGRRLPMIDRVVVDIVTEAQPRWLTFLNGRHDFIDRVPEEFMDQALPAGQLAPYLARRGMRAEVTIAPDKTQTCFNMDDPVVGGLSADKVALRRAIALAYDVHKEIQLVRHGRAIPGQAPSVPHTSGYDAQFKSEMSDHDVAKARALLDLYGYVDRNGDGWREQPDGRPLVIVRNTEPSALPRAIDQLWLQAFKALGIQLKFQVQAWSKNLAAAETGQFQMWSYAPYATTPDGADALTGFYGPEAGASNLARFRLPAFDALHDDIQALPDGPEREAKFREALRLEIAHMPCKVHLHRLLTDIQQPWMSGYRRPLFWADFWQFIDIDTVAQTRGAP